MKFVQPYSRLGAAPLLLLVLWHHTVLLWRVHKEADTTAAGSAVLAVARLPPVARWVVPSAPV